jgi:Leu/Phe-tRNA-protein transferase
LDNFHIPHSLRKFLKHSGFHYSINQAFETVLSSCAAPRAKQPDSRIKPAIAALYRDLWQRGFAHSVEVWQGAVGNSWSVGCTAWRWARRFSGKACLAVKPMPVRPRW